MKRTIGNRSFPLWLLGDSAPENWVHILEPPFDPRHPIRHNIWTSIENEIQDLIFRSWRRRLDLSESRLYIQNAVEHACHKPSACEVEWPELVMAEVASFKRIVNEHQPRIVLTFGSFAFEFGRRSFEEGTFQNYRHWTSKRLGTEFDARTNKSAKRQPTLVPLLHRSIAGGSFEKSHEYFCGHKGANYFSFTASRLADIITHSFSENDDIWVV